MNFAENQGTEVRFLIRGLEQKVDFSPSPGFNETLQQPENRVQTRYFASLKENCVFCRIVGY